MVDNAGPNSSKKSFILWQNEDRTVTLLDIPRSIELAQQFEDPDERKLWSSHPLEQPYPSLEPKSPKALAALKSPGINDLILHRVLTLALEEARKAIKKNEDGTETWCLPRSCYGERLCSFKDESQAKRHQINAAAGVGSNDSSALLLQSFVPIYHCASPQEGDSDSSSTCPFPLFKNSSGRTTTLLLPGKSSPFIIPVNSTNINGTIASTLPIFIQYAPKFPLIILDPPWPNRSARRARCYQTSYGMREIRELLLSIPVGSKLEKDGWVGIWITNKPSFRKLLLGKDGEGGLFDEWGVELVEEWVWLKTTTTGEPVSPLDGSWRKPYEILLIGRNISKEDIIKDPSQTEPEPSTGEISSEKVQEEVEVSEKQHCVRSAHVHVKRRVIIAVPDMHSRKPNIMAVCAQLLPCSQSPPLCLEIFARNLTAHSWAWGDEVLKFQSLENWTECANATQGT